MSVRRADKAGSWYPADPNRLRSLLDKCLEPGRVPPPEGEPVAAIVPHAGLEFSGATAGKAFAALRAATPHTVLVFGAVHTLPLERPAVWAEGAWQTPLGDAPVDAELAADLCKTAGADPDERPHQGDNAIEMQMPFIRHCFPGASVVPVAVPPTPDAAAFGESVWGLVASGNKRVAAVGSTDLTHYGASFGLMPAGTGQRAVDWTRENDQRLIDRMLELDAAAIVPTATQDHSACGAGAAAATVAYAKAAGAQGTLLEHTTSHDIMPQPEASHLVGYAALVFTRPQ